MIHCFGKWPSYARRQRSYIFAVVDFYQVIDIDAGDKCIHAHNRSCFDCLANELKGKLEKDSVLYTDGLQPYVDISLGNDLIHKRLNVSAGIKVIDKVFHIKDVNAYHSRLKGWLKRFHGVATKYIDHYLGWHRYMDVTEEVS